MGSKKQPENASEWVIPRISGFGRLLTSLGVMTNLKAEVGGRIYFFYMKIDESFRDLKNRLRLGKVMNKQQAKMEQLVGLVLLAFTLGLLVG